MDSTNRRGFLKQCLAALPALALASGIDADGTESPATTQTPYRTPAALDRYIDPLPIPKRLASSGKRGDVALYRVRMLEFKQQMHSQLPPTRLWGYEGQYPGPTFEANRGTPIEVEWENQLPSQHIFKIDPHIHGAMPPAPAVRTVPHLHGSRSRSESDGLPEKWFVPGSAARYSYPNCQPAATLWYHDHALGITRLNVYAGLSGFFLLRDNEERGMDLPSGDYEIPLVLQDRTLDDQGQLVYSPAQEDGQKAPPGIWAPEFFGDLPVVNGAIYPFLEVEPRPYRLRVLNSANSRFFNLFLNLAKRPTDIPSIVTFNQIGTDGGFLPKPVPLNKLLVGPAERADLIVDFSQLEGKTVTLSNNAPAPYPGWEFSIAHHAQLYELMQFRVNRALTRPGKTFSMTPSVAFQKLDEAAAIATRDFVLSELMDAQGNSLGVRINGKGYDEPVTEIVKLGSMEKWRFINTTDDAHPMHLHLVQFQILERQGFNPAAFLKGRLQFVGVPRPPAANEAGWKDTAIVNPRDVLTILVRFEGYTGRYVYHCHMLEHEDNDMMRPYEVVAEKQELPRQ
ncbi:MAG: multicopper oxidase domain-containing protein [Terracidiphilus sp.]